MSSIPPDAKTLPTGKPVGGLLSAERFGDDDLLALGAVDDYTDELAMGEDDDDEEDSDFYQASAGVLSLSFGAQTTQLEVSQGGGDLGTGAWDIGDLGNIQELVVQEVQGDFSGDGGESRMDVMVMEEEFDPDAEMITAVWDGPQGFHLGTEVRQTSGNPQTMPYWIVGAMLAAAGLAAVIGIVLVMVISLVAGPEREVVPLDATTMPKVEIERKEIKEQTADEILKEVLEE